MNANARAQLFYQALLADIEKTLPDADRDLRLPPRTMEQGLREFMEPLLREICDLKARVEILEEGRAGWPW